MKELEQLAEGTHAELQDKPKKAGVRDINGASDDFKENGIDALGGQSMDALTTSASQAGTSQVTLHEAQTMSAKQPSNRETLKEQQMTQKVNQDLFYQMQDEDAQALDSPEPVKDEKEVKSPVEEPMIDIGTPIKVVKTE